MASAKKCDICGKFYETPVCNDIVRIHLDYGNIYNRYIDLCDDCYKKLCDTVKPAIPEDFPIERYRK